MSLIKDILGGAVKGVKSLVQNAKIGREATASGFLTPKLVEQQQAFQSAAVAKSNNMLLIIGFGVVTFLLVIISIFKRK